jgi:hypothetical protein
MVDLILSHFTQLKRRGEYYEEELNSSDYWIDNDLPVWNGKC